MLTQRFVNLVVFATLLSFGCGGSDATAPRSALLNASGSSNVNGQQAELATKKNVLEALSYQGDSAADIRSDENGDFIEVAHGLGRRFPVVVQWVEGRGPGPGQLDIGNAFYVDENTIRIYLGPFEGTLHVRVVG